MRFRLKKLSISKKIALLYTGFLLVTLIIFNVVLQVAISYISLYDVQKELVSNTDTVESYIKGMDSFNADAFNNLKLGYNIFLNIVDEDKNIVYTNKADLPYLAIVDDNKMELLADKRSGADAALSYTTREIIIKDKVIYIQVARSTASYMQYLKVLGRAFALTFLVGIFIFLLSGRYLSKSVLKPIRNISGIAKEITSKSLNTRIPLDGPDDELKELAGVFNSMIERLESDFDRQKRFISDASHELRTPLAVIHGHVAMLNRWGKNDPEVLAKSLETLKAETQNMSSLIEKLLYLAKNDNSSLLLNYEEFDVCVLLKEVVDEALMIHEDYSIRFFCDGSHRITADYNAMKQVLRNLVDNGVKFSSRDGNIVIEAEKDPKGTVITVRDNGIGIPSESLPYIFDRFYRVDESRTKATGGSGLGLSIVQHIIQSHKGSITVESKPGEGTLFKIFLPDNKIS